MSFRSNEWEYYWYTENTVYWGYGVTENICESIQHVERDHAVIFISLKSSNNQEAFLLPRTYIT